MNTISEERSGDSSTAMNTRQAEDLAPSSISPSRLAVGRQPHSSRAAELACKRVAEVADLERKNKCLVAENMLLTRQTALLKEHASLKAVTMVGDLISWVKGDVLSNNNSGGNYDDKIAQPAQSQDQREDQEHEKEPDHLEIMNQAQRGIPSTFEQHVDVTPSLVYDDETNEDSVTWSRVRFTESPHLALSTSATGERSSVAADLLDSIDLHDAGSNSNSNASEVDVEDTDPFRSSYTWENQNQAKLHRFPSPPLATFTPIDEFPESTERRRNATFEEMPRMTKLMPNNDPTVQEHHEKPSRGVASPPDIKRCRRFIAEIAFQVDRRILNFVFTTKDSKQEKRLYGYILQNILEKIFKDSVDTTTGMMDREKNYQMHLRYSYILRFLAPLGYRIDHHAEISADLINKYGLLPISDRTQTLAVGPDRRGELVDILRDITPPYEIQDVLILLECLVLLARADGEPMFFM